WMGLGKGDEFLAPKIAELEKNNFANVDRMQIHVNFDRQTGKTTPSEEFLRSVAAKVHARGNIELQFMPWNIPDRLEYYYKLFDLGAGGLGTDRPDIAFEALRNYYKKGEQKNEGQKINLNDKSRKSSSAQAPVMVDVVFKFKKGKAKSKKFPLREEDGVQYLKIDPNEIPEKTLTLEVHHPWAEAQAGDPGFYVLCSGMYGEFKKRDQDRIHKNTNIVMPLIGIRTPKAAMAIIMTGMRYEAEHWVEYKKDHYRIYPVYKLDEEKAYDQVGIEFHLLKPNASYADIAKVYRKYQLDRKACVPLKERIKDRPALAYAAGAMEVRIRQGWKPVPSPVGEQTAETEPPMKVAVTFDRFMQIIDEFKKQGIDRAEFCLVGWNIGGHDGRFPQLFPVDPRLGGEKKLKEAIQKARKAGFLVVGHTSESGAYSISALANRWDRNYLLVRKGGVIKSLRTWSGGNVYHTCPEAVYERFVPEDYAKLKALGFYGLHYIDVYSTVNPRTCYSKDHPLTKEGFAKWSCKILAYAQKEIGGLGSEGGFDYCVSNLDYGLYISFYDPGEPVDPENRVKSHVPRKALPALIDRHTPFWQLVYNGIVLNNPFSNTANYTIKNAVNRLKIVEYGGRPLFYFYSKFLTSGSSWMGSADITCGTDEELVQSVKKIKEGYDEFEKLKYLQLEFMEDHQMLEEGLFKTSFSDGTDIICNYTPKESVYQGKKVPSLGYIVLKKTAVKK
ncbi:MAG: DUF5696 domain-containing protein, partial [Planctomycetia bacterium]|nr:DUF5696 domain-containing protein [Planctomycetia bacterium]